MFQSPSPVETVLASLVLAVCLTMLLRMLLTQQQKYRLDGRVRRSGRALRNFMVACMRWPLARRRAVRAADEAIRRARGSNGQANGSENGQWEGEREGNVYKPKSFRRPRKPH